MSSGLMDFGEGAFSGGLAGAQMGGGNPYAIVGGALLGGTMSFFGGKDERDLQNRMNKLAFAQNKQSLKLGELDIQAKERAMEEEDRRKRIYKRFGQMLRGA